MAEQEAALALAREQASELRASRAQLERALAASTAESAATIGALKASMQQQTAEALELEQLRYTHLPGYPMHADLCICTPCTNTASQYRGLSATLILFFIKAVCDVQVRQICIA